MANSAVIKHDAGYLSTLPLGSIIAWHRDFSETHAVSLPPGWAECNGQVLDDPESPYHDHVIPNLNGDAGTGQGGRFLRGNPESGILQEDQLQSHTHTDAGHQHFRNSQHDPELAWRNVRGGGHGVPTSGPDSWYNLDRVEPAKAKLGNPTTSTASAPRHGSETRPVNMSVVWIMKVKQVTAIRAVQAVQAHPQAPLGAVYVGAEGRVGIGTGERLPVAELEVAGAIRAQAVEVSESIRARSSVGSFFDKGSFKNSTSSSEPVSLITRQIELPAPTHVTVIGHGYGRTSSTPVALEVVIFFDGAVFDESWGSGLTHSETWVPVTAIASTVLSPGEHTIELRFRAGTGEDVFFEAPTMNTLLLGSP